MYLNTCGAVFEYLKYQNTLLFFIIEPVKDKQINHHHHKTPTCAHFSNFINSPHNHSSTYPTHHITRDLRTVNLLATCRCQVPKQYYSKPEYGPRFDDLLSSVEPIVNTFNGCVYK